MHSYRNHTNRKTWLQVMNEYRKKGVTAYKAGKKATDNPYRLGSSYHNAWEAGFISAQKEDKLDA